MVVCCTEDGGVGLCDDSNGLRATPCHSVPAADRAALPYFYAPVTALVAVNVVLFALTACAMHRRRRRRALNASITPLTADTTWYQRHPSTA